MTQQKESLGIRSKRLLRNLRSKRLLRNLLVEDLIRRQMLDIIQILFVGILLLVGLWIIVKAGAFFYRQISPLHEIVFTSFEPSNDDLNKQVPQLLSSKLRRLQLYTMQTPTGYGFLELPVLTTAPREAEEHPEKILKQLENIKLTTKEVDVNAVIKAIQEVLSPARYELRGRLTKFSNEIETSCELVYKDRLVYNDHPLWSGYSRSRFKSDKTQEKNGATDELPDDANGSANKVLDDILFQMIYAFMTQTSFEDWKISMKGEYRPKNWQALQAYILGVEALTDYQRSLDHQALKEALKYLGRLPIVAADDPYGFYYYGVALSEDRQEAEAVAVFQQLQRIPNAEAMKFEAEFNEATSRLKLYQLSEGGKAVETLSKLIKDLKEKINNISADDPKQWYYSKLLAISYAQFAYTHGTILSFRGHEGLCKPDARYATISQNIELAMDVYNRLTQEKKWSSDRERDDVLFRIKNAEGYSKFRYAQYQLTQNKIDNNKFKTECDSAIEILEKADQARPNHYEVLQNLAMIYEDEQFDHSGTYLDIAETLYNRTMRFVPNDYYQFEHLAYIQWRRLSLFGLPEGSEEIIKKGKEYASKAVALRPQTPVIGALILLARFNVRAWKNARFKNTTDDQSASDAISYFKQTLAARPDRADYRFEYAHFLSEHAEAAPKDAKVALEHGSSLLQLARMEGNEDQKKYMLDESIKLLDRAIKLTENADNDDKKQLNKEAGELSKEARSLLGEIQKPQATP